MMKRFCENSKGRDAVNCFGKKLYYIFLRKFKLGLVSCTFSCIVNKITSEDTEGEVPK